MEQEKTIEINSSAHTSHTEILRKNKNQYFHK